MSSASPRGAKFARCSTAALGLLLLFGTGCPHSHRGRHRLDHDGSAEPGLDAGPDSHTDDTHDTDDTDDMEDTGGGPDVEVADASDTGAPALDAQMDARAPGLDGATDAANPDASIDAGDEDDAASPAEAWPDLVFIRSQATGSSLHSLNTRNFGDVRRLDPEAAASAEAAWPLGYSPDGRKLLLQDLQNGPEFFVSYPCRAEPCVEPTSYQSVLEAPGTVVVQTLFAPDSTGVALRFDRGLWYVALGATAPMHAVRLVDDSTQAISFLRGGEALLAQRGSEVLLFDLRGATPSAVPIYRSQGSTYNLVAPDGEHFAVGGGQGEWSALATRDVLDGRATARAIAGDATDLIVLHATSTRLIVRDKGSYRAERWNGGDPVALPVEQLSGCGDRVIACKDGGVVGIDLPGAEDFDGALALRAIPELSCNSGRFLTGCRYYANIPSRAGLLYDWGVGALSTGAVLIQATPFDDGALVNLSFGAGLEAVLANDGGSLHRAYTARARLLGTYPVLAHHNPFLIAAGPLESPLDPGLYQVDMSAPLPARLRRLMPDRLSSSLLALTSDDRYLAFSLRRPNVPSDWDPSAGGVFELDLQTGTRRRISPAAHELTGGPQSMHLLPEQRSVLVYGNYEASGAARYYTAQLDAPYTWRAQTPPGRERWVDDGSGNPTYAFSSALGWLGGAGIAPAGPGVWLQRLALGASETPMFLGNIVDAAFDGAYARDKGYSVQGVARGLGLMFTVPEEVGTQVYERTLLRIDPISGATEIIVQAERKVLVNALAERSGRVFASRLVKSGPRDYGYVDAAEPTRWVSLLQANREVLAKLSPHERWLVFTEAESAELHCLELETGAHHVLALPDRPTFTRVGGVYSFELATFADDTRALVRLQDGTLHELTLGQPPQLKRILQGLQATTDLAASRDLQRLVTYGYEQAAVYHNRRRNTQTVLFARDQWTTDATLSPDGRWVLARFSNDVWQRFDAGDPSAAPQPLADSSNYPTLRFDQSGQHALGLSSSSHAALVWRLAVPSEVHALGGPGEVMEATFAE